MISKSSHCLPSQLCSKLKTEIEQTNADIEKAQREYDLNKAAELKYNKLPNLKKQLEVYENNIYN